MPVHCTALKGQRKSNKAGDAVKAIDNNPAEYWDLFDHNGNFVRVMQKGKERIPNHLYHITVEIIPTDKAGHLLLTQRHWMKLRGAGDWEFPAGSALSGETAEAAAIRELQEETGLIAQELFKIQETLIGKMLRVTFLAAIPDLKTASVILQDGETMDWRIVTLQEFYQMIAQGALSSERLQVYGERFYSTLEAQVGNVSLPRADVPSKQRKKKKVPVILNIELNERSDEK